MRFYALLLSLLWLFPIAAFAQMRDYIVRQGETLFSIARKHNTSVQELKVLNNLSGDNDLRAGMRILVPFPVFSNPDVEPFKYTPPRNVASAVDSMPPMEFFLSQAYADLILRRRIQVQNNFLLDASGELTFYINPNYDNAGPWRNKVRQFINTPEQLNRYLQHFDALIAILVKPRLENADRNDLVKMYQALKSFEYYELGYLNTDGYYVGFKKWYLDIRPAEKPATTAMTPYSTPFAPGILDVKFAVVRQSDRKPLPNTLIYALTRYHLSNPECLACLTSDYRNCDPAAMDIKAKDLVAEKMLAGPYHFVVTLKQSGLEKIIGYQKRKLTAADDGKTIPIEIPGY